MTFKEIVHVTSEDAVSDEFQTAVDEVGKNQTQQLDRYTSFGTDNETTTGG